MAHWILHNHILSMVGGCTYSFSVIEFYIDPMDRLRSEVAAICSEYLVIRGRPIDFGASKSRNCDETSIVCRKLWFRNL